MKERVFMKKTYAWILLILLVIFVIGFLSFFMYSSIQVGYYFANENNILMWQYSVIGIAGIILLAFGLKMYFYKS